MWNYILALLLVGGREHLLQHLRQGDAGQGPTLRRPHRHLSDGRRFCL